MNLGQINNFVSGSYALIIRPLSSEFQANFQQALGLPAQYLIVSELRQAPLLKALKNLRKLNISRLTIPIDDYGSLALLPILSIIAAVTKAKHIDIVYPDLSMKSINKWDICKTTLKLIVASLHSLLTSLRCVFQVKQLLKVQSLPTTFKKDISSALYLNANLWFGFKAGGSIGHIAGVVNALAANQLEIHYAAAEQHSLMKPAVNFCNLKALDSVGIPSELNYYRFNLQVANQLRKRYKSIPIQFIYQRMSIANYAGVLLSRRLKVPLILEYNGSEVWAAKNWGKSLRYHNLATQAEDVCLKHAHLIVTVSKVLRDELIARGIDAEKIVYYPNCIDPEMFDPNRYTREASLQLRRKYHIADDAALLTFVGTFGAWHGVEKLAAAIRELIEHKKEWLIENKVHFMLVGDGAKMVEVKTILNDSSYQRFFTLTGLVAQHEAPRYLAASDILLSPHVANTDGSKFFGSPTKLFEYMAMGKAILASNLEQIGEVLADSLKVNSAFSTEPDLHASQLAMLCEPGNIADIVCGIQFLVERPQWRETLGVNARKEALAKYTWEKHVDAILNRFA